MGEETPKVELSAQDGLIEIRYFDAPQDRQYRSWKLPVSIADSVIAWRHKIKKQKKIAFPLQEKTRVCEITMNSSTGVEIKPLDCRGRAAMIGWSLPMLAVDSLGARSAGRTQGKGYLWCCQTK